jgi:hypothetical protein
METMRAEGCGGSYKPSLSGNLHTSEGRAPALLLGRSTRRGPFGKAAELLRALAAKPLLAWAAALGERSCSHAQAKSNNREREKGFYFLFFYFPKNTSSNFHWKFSSQLFRTANNT